MKRKLHWTQTPHGRARMKAILAQRHANNTQTIGKARYENLLSIERIYKACEALDISPRTLEEAMKYVKNRLEEKE